MFLLKLLTEPSSQRGKHLLFGKVRLVDNTGNLERTFRLVAFRLLEMVLDHNVTLHNNTVVMLVSLLHVCIHN